MPKEKMQKSVQITWIIVIAVLILAFGGMYFYKTNFSNQNTILVNGQATEKVTPDLISIYFNVDTKGTTSKEADDANSLIVNKLKNAIVSLGFSEDELKTQNYNIYPNYDYTNGQKINGYTASHSLRIGFSIDKKNKIGNVIDAGANAGAGISYINFELSPTLEQQYKTQAIQTAADDARTKAEAIAQGFNKKLGRLVSVSLDSFNYYPFRAYDSSASGTAPSAESAKAATSITPSEQDVTAYVTAIYRLS